MKIYRCGIIGLGRQGAGIPEPYPVDKPRSHKEAYEMHPRCQLEWGWDLVYKNRMFGYEEMYDEDSPKCADIISICSPADQHWQAICSIDLYPQALFVEKPLADSVEICDAILEYCVNHQVVLAVNHQRAWEEHGEVVYRGHALETGTHAAEIANRHGFSLRQDCSPGKPDLTIHLRGYGPGISLAALDDIIACIEGRKDKPNCDGWAGREAVRMALESASPPLAVGFEGGTSGGETRGRSEVLAEAESVSPAV